MLLIYPSLMATKKPEEIAPQLEPFCAGFHLDIMDGIFVPNTALSIETANAIDAATKHPSWVHLMVETPDSWIAKLTLKNDSIISFHIESEGDHEKTIKLIKENRHRPSMAISPKTAVAECYPYLHLIDQLLVMSVEPGYSGQHFLPSALGKVSALIHERRKRDLSFTIALDGGITQENFSMIAAMETVDAVAIGSAIFAATSPLAATKEFHALSIKK